MPSPRNVAAPSLLPGGIVRPLGAAAATTAVIVTVATSPGSKRSTSTSTLLPGMFELSVTTASGDEILPDGRPAADGGALVFPERAIALLGGVVMVLGAAWLGGALVYGHGVGVRIP